jgi:ribose 5-phosphate isomerase
LPSILFQFLISVLECRFADGINNPAELENKINMIPGVVENGPLPDTKRFGKFRS